MALHLEDFLITGRTFGEYLAFFSLAPSALRGKRVLDCPGGVSAFTAEAFRMGIDAHACDIIYDFEAARIERQARASIAKIYEDTSWMEGHNWDFYGSLTQHRTCREDALATWSGDFGSARYSRQELPNLQFEEESFDLLLSSHLLFVYDDRLDLDFHLRAVEEMLRVAKEVRIFPLVDFKNSQKGEEKNLSPLAYAVAEHFGGEIVPVRFEFQPGANAMLRIRKQPA